MQLKEFMVMIQKERVRQMMLPMNQGMLYPMFTVTAGKLCAHILCHRSAVQQEGLKIWPPEYYFEYMYPKAKPLAVLNLKYSAAWADVDYDAPTLIPVRSPEEQERCREEMGRLLELGDELLKNWDENGSADPSAYNRQLARVLEPAQAEVYRRLIGEF